MVSNSALKGSRSVQSGNPPQYLQSRNLPHCCAKDMPERGKGEAPPKWRHLNNSGADPESHTHTKETDEEDEAVSLFLQRLGLDSGTLSQLVKDKDSFGLAVLATLLYPKRLPFGCPRVFDLSDSAAVKGAARPLFVRFLKRPQSSRLAEGESGVLQLNSITFAENSLGPEEAPVLFPLLVPSLGKLGLNGNPLNTEGLEVLAALVREEKAASLRELDLTNTGLCAEGQ
uniref:Uncharacterized protein n=1 Tax=Chromera velia CCMP2878 TaxID=1169474 RepID=A0A0K6SBH0_9ALVE|eukprot:Cvel_13630.t1-p1 / transcript=Cvel_13630.t1 / gene=Cvel_13630 / organism=Chromera_velia_CCMP2878 / gene_product=hypothetical protein / transcript_product=hypothetical protein / location=Cvel_scaffold939:31894-36167(-) / protein_length=228 / sequence_SO=supercontig / SO=protein_coding / is_pseudo=false